MRPHDGHADRPTRSESTRLATLEAATDLTTELGYDGVTIDAIASRAGRQNQPAEPPD